MEDFFSILFETPEKEIRTADEPAFFSDLNIDRIVDTILKKKEYADIRGFYYTPLKDKASVIYRQDIMRAIEVPELSAEVNAFLFSQLQAERAFENHIRTHLQEQKNKWLMDAAYLYTNSVRRFSDALEAQKPAARGLALLSGYLREYIGSERFLNLEKDARDCRDAFSSIYYNITFDVGRLFFSFDEEENADLISAIRDTFSPIAESKFDNTLSFFPGEDFNPLEKLVCAILKKKFPERFELLSAAAEKHGNFFEPELTRLTKELKFYTSFLEYITELRQAGMKFSYPEISDSKELRVCGGYDCALAGKYEKPAEVVVCNDFRLEGDERVFILTGPNQGGKTTFARSFGQILYLASLGLAAPCESATVPLAGSIYTHFAVEEDLSTHSGRLQEELIRLSEIMRRADGESVLIFNELFATTTTYDAIRLGGRVLKHIGELGAICLYVSHITDLCDTLPGSVSLVAEVVSPDNPERTYKIRRRKADGEAYADSIARKYGLSYREIMKRKGAAL